MLGRGLAILILLVVASGCQSPPPLEPRRSPDSAGIEVETRIEGIVLSAADDGTLTDASARKLRGFIADRDPYALRATVVSRTPAGDEAAESVVTRLRRSGVPAGQIRREQLASEDGPGDVVVTTRRATANLPRCPDWSRASVLDRRMGASSNFGCANTMNLGRMVADPADLKDGGRLSPMPGGPAVKALRRLDENLGSSGDGSGAAGGGGSGGITLTPSGSGGGS